MESASTELVEWEENVVYQMLEKVTVLDREHIRVTFRNGQEVEQTVNQPKRRSMMRSNERGRPAE